MDFAFTEDQLVITDAARKLLVQCCMPGDMRRLLDRGAPIDAERWDKIHDMGLPMILAPEAAGGMGLGLTDLIGIAEAAGYVGLPEPLVELAGIAVPLLSRFQDDRGWLNKVAEGAVVLVADPTSPFVAGADQASALLLLHGNELHVVETRDISMTRAESFDPFRRLFSLDWQPSAATRIGDGLGDAADRGAVLAAAQLVGLAQRCIDLAVAYAKDRVQFGKPIGSTQAVKHMIASAQVKVEFVRPVVHAAAAELPLGTRASRARVAHAKIAAGQAADIAARMAVQAHGAMGMTWEVDLHFFFKRALALNYAWGTPSLHRETVIDRISHVRTGPDATFASEHEHI